MVYPDLRVCKNLDEFTTVDDPRIENDNYDLNEEPKNNNVSTSSKAIG